MDKYFVKAGGKEVGKSFQNIPVQQTKWEVSKMTAVYVGIAIYFSCMIMVGYLVKSKVKTAEGYLVAGRAFGL